MGGLWKVMTKAGLMGSEAYSQGSDTYNRGSDKLIAPTRWFDIPRDGTYSGLGTAILLESKRCKVKRHEKHQLQEMPSSSWDKFLGKNSTSGTTMTKMNIPKILKTWFHELCQLWVMERARCPLWQPDYWILTIPGLLSLLYCWLVLYFRLTSF